MGGFWAAIFFFIHANGIWSKISEIGQISKMFEVTDKG
jgi:hypothetical protein